MKNHAFTLVEMVVAMTILVLIATIIGTASAMFYKTYDRTTKLTGKLKIYMAVDQIMDQSVRNAIPFSWYDENETKDRLVFEGKPDTLLFTALRRSHSGDRGAFIFVRLRLDDTTLLAEHSPYPRLPWVDEEGDEEAFTVEVISENVRAIKFLYAERNSEVEIEFLDEWIEEDHNGIPLAIQLEIEWNDGHRERWLRRTAGSAANAAFGNRRDQTAIRTEEGRGGIR